MNDTVISTEAKRSGEIFGFTMHVPKQFQRFLDCARNDDRLKNALNPLQRLTA